MKNQIIGTFQKSKNFGFVVPDDKKASTDIFISKKHIGKAKNNQKVVVEIIKYPKNNKNAEGIIKEIIGNRDEARRRHDERNKRIRFTIYISKANRRRIKTYK